MPVSSTRRRNQPQRNYKEEDPDDISLTEDSDALESADEQDGSSSYAYQDAQDFDMDEEETATATAPQARQARGGRRKATSSAKQSSSRSTKGKRSAPPPPPPAAARPSARSAASSSRSRKPPVSYMEEEDDDIMDEEDEEDKEDEDDEDDEDEEEDDDEAPPQRGQDVRGSSRRSPAKRQEFSPLSSEGEEEEREMDMEDEEIDLEDDAEGLGENEEEDIDVGMDEDQEEDEEEEDDEEEDEEDDEEGEESASTPKRGGKKGATASSGKGKGRALAKVGADTGFTDEEFSDDEFSTPQPGLGFGGNLTKRQRSKLDGSEALSLDFLELPSAASRKRHRTEEELALKKSELSRRRKNMTAQRAEQDKIDTINRLLKKQAGKRKKGGGDDEDGAVGGEGGSGSGVNRQDQNGSGGDNARKGRYAAPSTYLRTIYRVEGTTLSIPNESMGRMSEYVKGSIREPKGVKPLVAVSAAAQAEATGEVSHAIDKKQNEEAEAQAVAVHRAIEILDEPLLPLKAPAYPAPRGPCVVEGCAQTWKYRGVKSKKQVCGLEHLRLVENQSFQA